MMRRSTSFLLALSLVLGALLAIPLSVSATVDPAATETTAETTADTAPEPLTPAAPSEPATRGTIVQVAPFPPAPTTTQPPVDPLAVPFWSDTGRRVVYSKGRMRVWIIEADGRLTRTYLVSGRYSQPDYGTYSVFSRSSFTCNIKNPDICMRWMVRFTKGPGGDNIGFHEIPRQDGQPVQSDSQLGQALSGGCVRQATDDAWFMWNWAGIGTKVVVVP